MSVMILQGEQYVYRLHTLEEKLNGEYVWVSKVPMTEEVVATLEAHLLTLGDNLQ